MSDPFKAVVTINGRVTPGDRHQFLNLIWAEWEFRLYPSVLLGHNEVVLLFCRECVVASLCVYPPL